MATKIWNNNMIGLKISPFIILGGIYFFVLLFIFFILKLTGLLVCSWSGVLFIPIIIYICNSIFKKINQLT